MATIAERFSNPGGAESSVTIEKATPAQQRLGLAVLLTGRARPHDSTVEQFLAFVHQQKMTIDELYIAFRRGEAVASVLVVASPGRTGIVFISPTAAEAGAAAQAKLVRTACEAQNPKRIRLVQAILDPEQELDEAVLKLAGFRSLATLIYMHRGTDHGSPTLELEPGVQISRWTPENRPLFAAGIRASYEQTLDCPGLLGLRTMDDIIAGHMAGGQFMPDLWLALSRGDEPLGVMLINLVPHRRAAELVYLGLGTAARGMGLGRKLLQHGLFLASKQHATSLSLAVDDQNTPAMKLYESMRFVANSRKLAMILPMPAE